MYLCDKYTMMVKRVMFILFFTFAMLSVRSQNDLDSPTLLSASIESVNGVNDVVRLTWELGDTTGVTGYCIYRLEDGETRVDAEHIDLVDGNQTTSYDKVISEALLNAPLVFRLAACGANDRRSALTPPQTTTMLTTTFDKCENTTTLTWTSYKGWPKGVDGYAIYRVPPPHPDTDPTGRIGGVSSSDTTFCDTTPVPGAEYTYYVRAKKNTPASANGVFANSNRVKVYADSYPKPEFLRADYATVVNNSIELGFTVDGKTESQEYRIMRSDAEDGDYQLIASVKHTGTNDIFYTDNNVLVDKERYFYRIESVNPCGTIDAISNVASNIVLTAVMSSDLKHDLTWNQYSYWSDGVKEYKISRLIDDNATEIAINDNDDTHCLYDISDYISLCHGQKVYLTNKFCYYVEAVQNVGGNVSRSNTACLYHTPVVWMPTAFNVGSLEERNRIFKPVISFTQKHPYEFKIYDKWGNEIFRTKDIEEGWNGLYKDAAATAQVYTYFIRYYDSNEKEHTKSGTFFLFAE